MNMDISVICRANEVRSPTAAAYLKYLIPDLNINSFGTDTSRISKHNSYVAKYLMDWGIEFHRQRPESVKDNIDQISKAKTVLACDEMIVQNVSSIRPDVLNLKNFAIDNQHKPLDPISFSAKDFADNLSKIIHCTIRFSISEYSTLGLPFTSSASLVPRTVFNFRNYPSSTYIDTRLKTRNLYENMPNQVHWFTEQELQSGQLAKGVDPQISVYAPKFEFRRPEFSLMSRQWIDFVRAVEALGPTTLLVENFEASKSSNACSYLATALASSVG